MSLISPLKTFVTKLERKYFNPIVASYDVVHRLNLTISNVFEKAKDQSYDLSQIGSLEDEVENQVNRFWAWTRRRVITVTEACAIFKRSRSTIYRWIKQGKFLGAMKTAGKWSIAI